MCNGERAKQAAIYPVKLCKFILKGISKHMRDLGHLHDDTIGPQYQIEEGDGTWNHVGFDHSEVHTINHNNIPASQRKNGQEPVYKDAMTGQPLDPKLVMAGRAVEMDFLHEWVVYDYADFDECFQQTGAGPISTKWFQTN